MANQKERPDDGTSVIVKLVGPRLAFPSVFAKDKYDRYSAALLMPPGKFEFPAVLKVLEDDAKREAGLKALKTAADGGDNYAKVVLAVVAVAKAKWQGKWLATLKSLYAKDDLCLHNGDNKPDLAGYPGNYYVSATNQSRPTLLDRNRNDIEEKSPALLYSGCYPVAVVEIWAQDNPQKSWKRVNCQLQGLQHYKEGERTGGGGRVADKNEFDDLGDPDESSNADDLVGGGDDDIPF